MEAATKRMADVLNKLPKEITPVNLEELRRVKQALVELESKADQLRQAHIHNTWKRKDRHDSFIGLQGLEQNMLTRYY